MNNNYRTLDDIKSILSEITDIFLKWSEEILDINNLERLSIVGIGNSINSGWTNHSDDVAPLMLKLLPYIESSKSNIILGAFPIGDNNSNTNILKFLESNPTEFDTYNRMIKTLDLWNHDFKNTPLRYSVSNEKALSFYPDVKNVRLSDYYDDKTLTITSFSGFTGELLTPSKLTINEKIENEFKSMIGIIQYILGLSNNSYLIVGNFPKLVGNSPIVNLINNVVNTKINDRIRTQVCGYEPVMYFDEIYLRLVNYKDDDAKNIIDAIRRIKSLNVIKLDNHPNVNLQYLYLCKYLLFMIEKFPLIISKNRNENMRLAENYSANDKVKRIHRILDK